MVFASFVRDSNGVREIREVLGEKGKKIRIVPKIENQQVSDSLLDIARIMKDWCKSKWNQLKKRFSDWRIGVLRKCQNHKHKEKT